jgi:hypothetical protein
MHWHSLSLIQLLNDHTFFVPFGCPCDILCMYISIFQQFIAHLIYMHPSFPFVHMDTDAFGTSTHPLQNPHCKLTVCYFPCGGIWTLSPGLAHDWATFSVLCIYFIFQANETFVVAHFEKTICLHQHKPIIICTKCFPGICGVSKVVEQAKIRLLLVAASGHGPGNKGPRKGQLYIVYVRTYGTPWAW